jgi:hypothetical protein
VTLEASYTISSFRIDIEFNQQQGIRPFNCAHLIEQLQAAFGFESWIVKVDRNQRCPGPVTVLAGKIRDGFHERLRLVYKTQMMARAQFHPLLRPTIQLVALL